MRKIPYIFAMENPKYPIAEGFEVDPVKGGQKMDLRMYLPFGADAVRFSLYDSDSLLYIRDLADERDIKRGLFTKRIPLPDKISSNYYEIVTEVEKDNQKLVLKNTIYLQIQLE